MNSPKIIKHVEYRHLLDSQVPISSYDLFENENNRYAFITFFNSSLYCVKSFKIKFIFFDENKEKISEDVYSFQPEVLISHRKFKPIDPIVMPKNADGFNYEIFDVDIPDKNSISHQSLRLQAVPKDTTLSLGKAKTVKSHSLNKISTIFCLCLLVLASAFLCVIAGINGYLADTNSYLYYGNFTHDGIKYKTIDDGYVEIVEIDCDKAIKAARDKARSEYEKKIEEEEKNSSSSSSTYREKFDESSITTITIDSYFTDNNNNQYIVDGFNSESVINHTTFTGNTVDYGFEFNITNGSFSWTAYDYNSTFAVSPFVNREFSNLVINLSSGNIPEGLFNGVYSSQNLTLSGISSIKSYAFIKTSFNRVKINYNESTYCNIDENAGGINTYIDNLYIGKNVSGFENLGSFGNYYMWGKGENLWKKIMNY